LRRATEAGAADLSPPENRKAVTTTLVSDVAGRTSACASWIINWIFHRTLGPAESLTLIKNRQAEA